MKTYTECMREANELIRKAEALKSQANGIKNTCQHHWSDAKYVPIERPGHYVEGDAPGTMGVDWRPGYFVSAETTKQWERTCKICGYKQTTQETKLIIGENGLKQEVPSF